MGAGGSLGNPRRGSHHTSRPRPGGAESPRLMLTADKVCPGRQGTALPAAGYLAGRANGVPADGEAANGHTAYRMVDCTMLKPPFCRIAWLARSPMTAALPRFDAKNRDGRPAGCRRAGCREAGMSFARLFREALQMLPDSSLGIAWDWRGVLADCPWISDRDQSRFRSSMGCNGGCARGVGLRLDRMLLRRRVRT